MERERGRDRKEGYFMGEKLSTLACPVGAHVYCCLQV